MYRGLQVGSFAFLPALFLFSPALVGQILAVLGVLALLLQAVAILRGPSETPTTARASVAPPCRSEIAWSLAVSLWTLILLYAAGLERLWPALVAITVASTSLGVLAARASRLALFANHLLVDVLSQHVSLNYDQITWLYREDEWDGVRHLGVIGYANGKLYELEIPDTVEGQAFWDTLCRNCAGAALGYRPAFPEIWATGGDPWQRLVEQTRSEELA